jgi:hypothetical protein
MKTKHGIFFGFAAMLAAAIFTLAGCPTDGGGGNGGNGDNGGNGGNVPTTNGSLTITGISSEHNGKYVVAMKYPASQNDYMLMAVENIVSVSEEKVTAARITNGTATLKVYKAGMNGSVEGYSENETVTMTVRVFSNSIVTFGGSGVPSGPIASSTVSITFANGSGQGTVNVPFVTATF